MSLSISLQNTDLNMKDYCREIDLPGFEDNISLHNKMFAVIQIQVQDAGVIFDRCEILWETRAENNFSF